MHRELRLKSWFLFVCFLAVLASCISRKKVVYFNSSEPISGSDSTKNYTPVFKTDDFLSITVMGLDPEAVRPFNLPTYTMSTNSNNGYTSGMPVAQGYLIDANGMIDFPVLGKIKLAGVDRMTATAYIKEKLTAYVVNPIVHMRILNFKITVLGDVRMPGTFSIPNERVTLPEALGIAGDMNITGVRKNVLVIRDVDGKKTETRVDLTSKKLFSSPVYYLNQNDIVYVEPNRARVNSSIVNTANVGITISVITLLITVLVLLRK